ncbi:hypothetical protein [Natronorubrum sp. A-ect3]|uniref:hypothetical protein n=1 Tax=Natronorubrum sp. A-ect3 TaxID=3242698 RepID=UPI00359EB9A8
MQRRSVLRAASTFPLLASLPARSGAATEDGFTTVRGVNASEYPTIETTCIVETKAGQNGSLTADAFTLEEAGKDRSIDDIDIVEIDRSGEPEPIDIVFVFDDTGSMGDVIDGMQAAVTEFIDDLVDANVDGRFGLVSFKQDPDEMVLDQELTRDADAVQDAVNGLVASGGGPIPENPLDAIDLALGLDYRDDARQVMITIMDAPARHGRDNERNPSRGTTDLTLEVIKELLTDTIFIAISPTDDQISSYLPPEGGFMNIKRIAEQTDGFWLELPPDNIFEEFQQRLDIVQETLAATRYQLEYETPLPEDGELRTVRCTVDDPKEGTDDDTGEYRPPGFAPGTGEIKVTRSTTTVNSPVTLQVFDPIDSGYRYEWEIVKPSDADAELLRESGFQTYTAFFPKEAPEEDYALQATITEFDTDEVVATATRTISVEEQEVGGVIGDDTSVHELVKKYAPRYYFTDDEEFFPTRYEAFVENAEVRIDEGDETIAENLSLLQLGNPDLIDDGTLYNPGLIDPDIDAYDPSDETNRLFLKGDLDDFKGYQERYPETIHANVVPETPSPVTDDDDYEDDGGPYTAITYWAFYLYDPKKEDAPEDQAKSWASAHISDTETVTILLDESGPQWIGAAQHYSGEYTRWEKVAGSSDVTTAKVYPSQGAHSSFLVNTDEYDGGIPAQTRWLFESVDETRTLAGWEGPGDVTADDERWDHTGKATTNTDEEYDLVVLPDRDGERDRNNENWATFNGSFSSDTSSDGKFAGGGQLAQARGNRWSNPGEWMPNRMLPEHDVLDDDIIDTELPGRFSVDTVIGKPSAFVVENFNHPGKKPHDFWAEAIITPDEADTEVDSLRIPLAWDARWETIEVPLDAYDLPDEGWLTVEVIVRTHRSEIANDDSDRIFTKSATTNIGDLYDMVTDVGEVVGEEFCEQAEEFCDFAKYISEEGEEIIEEFGEKGEEFLEDVAETSEEFLENVNEAGEELLEDVREEGEEILGDAGDRGEEFIEEVTERGEDFVEDIGDRGEEFIEETGEEAEEFIEDVGGGAKDFAEDVGGGAKDFVEDVGEGAVDVVTDPGGTIGLGTVATETTSADEEDESDMETVAPGEEVTSTITVTNNSSDTESFYVTLTPIGPDGGYYENPSSGREVELDGDESRETTLSWPVTRDVPEGVYNLRTQVWLETDPDDLNTELTSTTDEDAFAVEKPSGELEVTTTPTDVYVQADREALGQSPISTTLPVGTYRLLAIDDVGIAEQTVEITEAEPTTVSLELGIDRYLDADGTVDIDAIREAVDDWRDGRIETARLDAVVDAWKTGEPVE